jgi:mercuric ion binding protein
MHRLLPILLVAVPVFASAATPQTVTLAVQKMTCALCPVTIKKSLEKVPGVNAVVVDFGNKTATITYDPDKTTPDALSKATADAGYPSTMAQ